nr:hypothetical protein Itr_chr01CG05800 [Ipomoea trifida]
MEIVKKKVGRKRRLWSSTCRNNRLLTLAALHFAVAVVPATKSVWRSRLAAVREQIDEDLLLMLFETQIGYIDFCIAYNGFNPLPIKSGPYKVKWVEPVNFSASATAASEEDAYKLCPATFLASPASNRSCAFMPKLGSKETQYFFDDGRYRFSTATVQA